jgi:hypothetical protein
MDRVTEAFAWPLRDPRWLVKVLVIGLILLIPIAGQINGLGWMLAALDRLRAGEERLPPANFGYLGRGIRLFVVQLVYGAALLLLVAVFYLPAVLVFVREGRGAADVGLISIGLLLNLLSFSAGSLGGLALNFLYPSIVLATESGGITGGLRIRDVLRRARASITSTLIAGLMLIAASFIGSLGSIACVVGIVFTLAYSLAVQAWIIRSFEIGAGAPSAA